MEQLDTNNFIFMKNKNTKNYKQTKDLITKKKNYNILNENNNKIYFELKNIKIPFGIESYNNQQILNIAINPNNNNDHYNYLTNFKNFENNLINLDIIDNEILSETKEKKYHCFLKQNADYHNYTIRTHILGSTNIYTLFNGKKFPTRESDIKNKNANILIEIGTFWITDETYGILLNTKEIIII